MARARECKVAFPVMPDDAMAFQYQSIRLDFLEYCYVMTIPND